ncbi:MAG: glycoside hydrolase family 1 protein [Deltaproteobacteria bacterium]|nr:glycoside hydrolase family 1 protein [Deltaproteobacteria bacterium]
MFRTPAPLAPLAAALLLAGGCSDDDSAADVGPDVPDVPDGADGDADGDDDGSVADVPADDAALWPDAPVDVRFPDGFLWGSASAAYQVEGRRAPDGGTVASNWSEWEDQLHIIDHQTSGRGAGFWELYEEDLDRAVSMGHNAVRLGVEWARIEPERDVWDDEALEHYRTVVRAARDRELQVFVTLYHWVVPLWVQSQLGRVDLLRAEGTEFEDEFEEFARHVVPALAAEVDQWIPLNEPFTVMSAGYLSGDHPPGGILDLDGAQLAGVHFIFAHARAAAAIRELDLIDADGDTVPALVGNAAVAGLFPPKNPADPDDVFASERIEYIVNDVFPEAWTSGRLDVNMDGDFDDVDTVPPEGTFPELAGTLDWLGINYYGPGRAEAGAFGGVAPLHGLPLLDVDRYDPLLPHNEMRREIDAGSFLATVRRYGRWGLPLYVTENGCSDSGDTQRPFYLLEHVRVVGVALGEGFDLRGYLHWSLTDNFEWSYGFGERFGLYRIDFADEALPREETAAARLYREIIAAGGIDDAIWGTWALPRYPTDGRP